MGNSSVFFPPENVFYAALEPPSLLLFLFKFLSIPSQSRILFHLIFLSLAAGYPEMGLLLSTVSSLGFRSGRRHLLTVSCPAVNAKCSLSL